MGAKQVAFGLPSTESCRGSPWDLHCQWCQRSYKVIRWMTAELPSESLFSEVLSHVGWTLETWDKHRDLFLLILTQILQDIWLKSIRWCFFLQLSSCLAKFLGVGSLQYLHICTGLAIHSLTWTLKWSSMTNREQLRHFLVLFRTLKIKVNIRNWTSCSKLD